MLNQVITEVFKSSARNKERNREYNMFYALEDDDNIHYLDFFCFYYFFFFKYTKHGPETEHQHQQNNFLEWEKTLEQMHRPNNSCFKPAPEVMKTTQHGIR